MKDIQTPPSVGPIKSRAEVEHYVTGLAVTIKQIVGKNPRILIEAYRHKNNDYIGLFIKGVMGDFPVIFTIGGPLHLPEPEPAGIDIWVANTADALNIIRLVAIAVRGDSQMIII